MKKNASAPPQMSGKERFEEITQIIAKGFRRLRGEQDDTEELPSGPTMGSNDAAGSKSEKNLSDCLDYSGMSSNL